jgi:hypothetical protein
MEIEELPPKFQFRLRDLFALLGATAVAMTFLRLSILVSNAHPLWVLEKHLSILATVAAFGAASGALFRRMLHVAVAVGLLYIAMAIWVELSPTPRRGCHITVHSSFG